MLMDRFSDVFSFPRRAVEAAVAIGLRAACVLAACALCGASARADLCTTQSRMSEATRGAVAAAALDLAHAVQAGDVVKVRGLTVAEYTANFDPTAYLVRSTAAKLNGTTPAVSEVFTLDASARKAGDASAAEFSCALSGSSSEVDFSIAALPPGTYAFALVEARGTSPWLLSFLLREEAGAWKMAGFYPHPRSVAARDGLWYWSSARDRAKSGQKWLAWALYGQADELLRPANFVTSTHLDALRTEQRSSAPGELSDGISAQTPLVVKSAAGREFHFTDLRAQGSEDGKRLNLILHVTADPAATGTVDAATGRAGNLAAAATLLSAHRELREGFSSVWVFSEAPGQNPFVTEHPLTEIP